MVLEEERPFDRATLLISFLCLLGAGTGIFLLYRDLTTSGGAGVGEAIARIERRDSTVRRRVSTSFYWRRALSGESLYRRDSIQTGPDGDAKIRFDDGTELEVGEDSLVILNPQQDLPLSFVHGSGIIRSATGDQQLTASEDGKITVRMLPARLLEPATQAQFFVEPRARRTVTFRWEARSPVKSGTPSQYTVEVSRDSSFKTLQKLEGSRTALDPGSYFWRVRRSDGDVSETRAFRIDVAEKLKPLWPGSGDPVMLWSSGECQFRWMPNVAAGNDTPVGSDEIEVAGDPDFQRISVRAPVLRSRGEALLTGVPEGKLYWRIRSEYGDVTVYSEPLTFATRNAHQVTLSLVTPTEGMAASPANDLRFTWRSDSPDAGYVLEVENTEDHGSILSFPTHAMSYVWSGPLPGRYQWRVRAPTGGDAPTETAWQTFTIFSGDPIALLSPAPDREIRYWERPERFSFEWREDSVAKGKGYPYRIEIARDADFKNVVATLDTKDTRVSSQALELPSGTLFWRVHVIGPNGTVLQSSPSAHLTYGVHLPLRAPASVAPESGQIFDVVREPVYPTLQWTPVADARRYEVLITSDRGRVIQKIVESPTLSLKDLPEGKYRWTVRGIDPLERRGDAAPQGSFVITYGAPLDAPEITTPEVQ